MKKTETNKHKSAMLAKLGGMKIIWVSGITLMLLLALISVVFLFFSTKTEGPEKTVKDFLTAIGNADSETALKLLQTQPETSPLLNKEILQASKDFGNISNIETRNQINLDSTVYATYNLGNEIATQVFKMVKTDNGWRIANKLSTLTVPKDFTIKVKLNGLDINPGEKMAVFPGRYQATTENKLITLSENAITVKLMDDTYNLKPEFKLNEEGEKLALTEAKKSLDACIGSHNTTSADCPNVISVPDGVTVKTDSVTWSLKNDPLANVKFQVSQDGVAHAILSKMDFNVKYKYKYGVDRSGDQDVSYENVRCDVNILQDPAKVSWPR